MRPSILEEDAGLEEEPNDEDYRSDLLCGIGPKHIRMLCENSWNGGFGYSPREVGDLTIDQIFMLLCDRKMLREKNMRTEKAQAVSVKIDEKGFAKGRTSDGKEFKAKVGGESLASRLRREQEATNS